ncbi:MAG: thermonuclease family protein [Rickettsiales bacterium]|nr:thermonuclease family protein [Rickettsiales bacterium]
MKNINKIFGVVIFVIACAALYLSQGPDKATKSVSQHIVSDKNQPGVRAISGYVIDGDTFVAKVVLENNVQISVRVRIMQIDAPEIHGECDSEIAAAQRAKARLENLLPQGSVIYLSDVKDDKYLGRIDAFVKTEQGVDIGEIMVKEGLARRYGGGRRAGWCD